MKTQLDVVNTIYAAFGKGDVATILANLSPTVGWETWPDNFGQRAGVPWLISRTGHEGAAAFFASLQELEIQEFQVAALLEGGNQVAAEIRLTAVARATGIRFRDEELHLWTFGPDRLVTRFRHYVDTAKHMSAAGVWPAKPMTPGD